MSIPYLSHITSKSPPRNESHITTGTRSPRRSFIAWPVKYAPAASALSSSTMKRGENGLAADFQDGWATVYIVRECEHYFEFVNSRFPTSETPLTITGDGPTPKKHATEDMGLIAEILLHFAQTGEVYPDCAWEHTLH